MKSKIPLVLFITLMVHSLHANYAFKKKVKAVCGSYRVDVQPSQLSLEPNQLTISLESGRNNFEMFMLVGFASAGQAISHQKQMNLSNSYTPSDITVSVSVPISKGEFNTFIASCKSEDAISLANGILDSSVFMQNIMKNMEIK